VCVHRVALPGFEDKVGATATPHFHPDEPGHHEHGHHH
jgi:sirohydrochlorin cobaltochelatase